MPPLGRPSLATWSQSQANVLSLGPQGTLGKAPLAPSVTPKLAGTPQSMQVKPGQLTREGRDGPQSCSPHPSVLRPAAGLGWGRGRAGTRGSCWERLGSWREGPLRPLILRSSTFGQWFSRASPFHSLILCSAFSAAHCGISG